MLGRGRSSTPVKRSKDSSGRFWGYRKTGPSIGVEPLRERFEGLARSEAREILGKYREHYQRMHPRALNELRWVVPGAVWAMDHTEGPRGEEVLAVRDLALGRKVLWKEVVDLGAEEVVEALEPVLERERPLVLKVDRELAFRSKGLEESLPERGVVISFFTSEAAGIQ